MRVANCVAALDKPAAEPESHHHRAHHGGGEDCGPVMNRIGGRTIMFRLLRLTQLKRPPTEAALLLVSEHRYLPIQLP